MTKSLRDYIAESEHWVDNPVAGDDFAINIREECLLESHVVDVREDAIVIEADDRMLELLESYGLLGSEELAEFQDPKDGVAEGLINEKIAEGIVYATGPRSHGINDVDLIFKNLRTNKIVASVLGNNDHGGIYEIKIDQNGLKPQSPINFVATGNPQDGGGEHFVYKLSSNRGNDAKEFSTMRNGFDTRNNTYYGMNMDFIGDDDYWSFLENMIGDIMWEDDAIEAGYVDRLDNGDLVFVKNQGVAEQIRRYGPAASNSSQGFSLGEDGGDLPEEPAESADDVFHISRILELAGLPVTEDEPIAAPQNANANDPLLGKAVDDAAVQPMEEGDLGEAEYRGRDVPLGKPMAGDVKKKKVYVRKPNGNVVKVEFGDKNMRIKKSNPKRRKSFRARHNCENPGPRWKARYWSCRAW